MRRHPWIVVFVFAILFLAGVDTWAQTDVNQDIGEDLEEGTATTEVDTTPPETNDGSPSNPETDAATDSGSEVVDEVTLRVQRHDERAQELFVRGDYEGALTQQRQAQALLPATPRLFNMAVCEERLGNLESALDLYETFLSSDDAPAERRGQARQSIEHLTDQIAAARAAATAEAQSPTTPERTEPTQERSIALAPAVFWATLGVSVACLVTTAVLGAVTLVRHEEFLGLYRDDPDSLQLQEQGTNMALATNIMLGVTALVALTTLVFGLDTDWERRRRRSREERVAIVPSGGPGGGGLAIVGRY